MTGRCMVGIETVPGWLRPLLRHVDGLGPLELGRIPPPEDCRPAAVLILLGGGPLDGADILLLRRADDMSSHAGQVAFPGGALDPDDGGDPVAAALREAREEVGVHPPDVRPVALLPEVYLPPSGFRVTPVLAHWVRQGPVAPVDPRETAAVARVPMSSLADPDVRVWVNGPSGRIGPGFVLPDMLVWGFTGGLVSALLRLGGWERPWPDAPSYDLTAAALQPPKRGA